ncbi:MAG TPA: anti-sigma factor [Afipia sp.]
MTTYSDDHIALAAEYALGTLDADERALVETMMIVDHGFMEIVEAWDRKLSPLHQMVASVDAPPHLWAKIKTAIETHGEQAPVVLPAVSAVSHVASDNEIAERSDPVAGPELDVAAEPVAPAEPVIKIEARDDSDFIVPRSEVVPLPKRKRSGSYAFGMVASALAASFAAVAALQLYRPDLLPVQLRVKPKVQTVEIRAPAPPPPAQLVAVLQQNAAEPAFILTVDQATKSFTVRRVGAAPPPDKSFELWLVSDKLPRPRSLGVIGESDFTSRAALAAFDADTINQAIYAVTVEPAGGSPTGNPTTNPIYAGKLIESVPAGGQSGR